MSALLTDLAGLENFPWNLLRRFGLAWPCLSPVLIMLAIVLSGEPALDCGLDWEGLLEREMKGVKGVPRLRD